MQDLLWKLAEVNDCYADEWAGILLWNEVGVKCLKLQLWQLSVVHHKQNKQNTFTKVINSNQVN